MNFINPAQDKTRICLLMTTNQDMMTRGSGTFGYNHLYEREKREYKGRCRLENFSQTISPQCLPWQPSLMSLS